MEIHASPALYARLMAETSPAAAGVVQPFGFARIIESRHFPFDVICAPCAGTGEDPADGAYCRDCRGAGRSRHIGTMIEGNAIVSGRMSPIVEKLPARFAPRFPRGLVVLPPAVKIVASPRAFDYETFAADLLRRLAASLGISYEQLSAEWLA